MDINNNSAQKIGLDYILERGVADYSDGDIVIFEHLGGKSVDGSVKLDMIMMVYCVKGRMQCDVNGKTYTAKAGEVMIGLPNNVYSNYMISPDFESRIFGLSYAAAERNMRINRDVLDLIGYVATNPVISLDNERQALITKYYSIIAHKIKSPHGYFHKEIMHSLFQCAMYELFAIIAPHVQYSHDGGETKQANLLFRKFASDCAEKYHMPPVTLEEDARQLLLSYRWPGNVRELKNVTERLSVIEEQRNITANVLRLYLPNISVEKLPVLLHAESEQKTFNSEREILYQVLFDMKKDVNDLKKLVHDIMSGNMQMPVNEDPTAYTHPLHTMQSPMPTSIQTPIHSTISTPMQPPIQEAEDVSEEETVSLADMEKQLIRKVLEKHKGRRKSAAAELDISERTLYRKIKELNLE